MDDEPMWAADHVVALTPGSAITIPETENEFDIKGSNSKAYQPPQACNEHVNAVFTRSGKSYNPPDNPDNKQKNSKNLINFDSDDEDDEPTPQPKTQPTKPVKETSLNRTNHKFQEDVDDSLGKESKIPHSIKGTLLEEEIFFEFDKFMAMTADENFESESDTK
ncbi:hypothetical protein Tco_1285664 [Tanacetum coccineum]